MKNYSRKFSLRIFLLFIPLIFFQLLAPAQSAPSRGIQKSSWPIITRKGDKLYEGEKPFRFFGLAAPNIQQNESQIREDRTNRFPDEYEIRDALGGMQHIGGRATRTFSLSVYTPADKGMPVYITGTRNYNEVAFRCLDMVIALCHEYDIRLIVPFIASQSFGGIRGVDEFSDLSGKPRGSFWTDESVKDDFKHLLHFILNRKNTVNGILYKDDPAILAWQLGNEFGSYAGDRKLDYNEWSPRILKWSVEMATYIKKIDPNHLLMEAGGVDRAAMIADPNIDLISDHLYEYWNRMGGQPWELAPIARSSVAETRGKKPLVIDEFGLGSTDNLRTLMQAIRGDESIVGGLLWSIRSHRRDGGWYYHNEGGTPVNSFHVPGFAAGFEYEETRLLDLLRSEAYLIRGMKMPPVQKPSTAPVLFAKGDGFTWRGSTGAAMYTIERAETPRGPFIALATGLHDSVIGDVKSFEGSPRAPEPLILFYDETRKPGITYHYRIKGINAAGESGWSPVLTIKP